ncbi:MAG: DUF6526 family protein [Ferruginibacter sp.]
MQTFKNHSRYLPVWHLVILPLIIAALVFSVMNFIHATAEVHMSAAIILVLNVLMLFIWFYSRRFALKAQDRAIRAEESFRYFILTGKPVDRQLRLGQIIALRFASDEEMPALAKKAVAENLSSKAIKMEIKNWREDMHRV